MGSLNFLLQYRPFFPWICSSICLGYVAYLSWKLKRLKEDSKKQPINKDQDKFQSRHEVNIDTIDRKSKPKKRVSYCRCWKSSTFPFCDGAHKQHNRENDDKVGALVLVWNDEPEPEPELGAKQMDTSMSCSIIEPDPDMDIKSIDSESPSQSPNGNIEPIDKMGDTTNTSSDEQLSSLEMIEDNFDARPEAEKESKDDEDEDFDEDTVKVSN